MKKIRTMIVTLKLNAILWVVFKILIVAMDVLIFIERDGYRVETVKVIEVASMYLDMAVKLNDIGWYGRELKLLKKLNRFLYIRRLKSES